MDVKVTKDVDGSFGVYVDEPDAVSRLSAVIADLLPTDKEVVVLCIGTDRSTGDSYGPLVGTKLKEAGLDGHYGCLDFPIHGGNLKGQIKHIRSTHPGSFVLAIDAALGKGSSVGKIKPKRGPIDPGSGVGRAHLTSVGDASIIGVVNIGGLMEYFVLQNTRLGLVMKMATVTAHAIRQALEERKTAVAAAVR